MNTSVIVAAGRGTRMTGTTMKSPSTTKPFIDLNGVPVIIHTLRQFDKAREIDSIIVVLLEESVENFLSFSSAYGIRKLTHIVAGGDSRGESVWHGLLAVEPCTAEIVAVHDGVRPLVTSEEIDLTINTARATGAAILAAPCVDTIKKVESGLIVGTCERGKVWRALTPQAFSYELLMRAYKHAREDNFSGTDESQLVERLGISVTVVEGRAQNIKITYPEDLKMAELILQSML